MSEGKLSYGGNQQSADSAMIGKCGCGIIAATDTLLYLSRYHLREPVPAFRGLEERFPLSARQYYDCIAVMRKVNFHIVDWSRDVEGDVEAESELPHIRLSACMIFPHFADDRDAIEKIYYRRMEFPHDGIEENYKWARLLDAEDGLVIYNYQLAEDIDERLLEDEIKFMFEFTDRRMKKIGFLRTS